MARANQRPDPLPPLLADLPDETRARLVAAAETRRFASGALLQPQGEPLRRLPLVLDGVAGLVASGEGGEAVVRFAEPPEPVLLAAALADAPCLAGARALSDVKLLSIDAGAVRAEARRCGVFALFISQCLARQARSAVRQIGDLKLRDGARRLGDYLLRLVSDDGNGAAADLPVSKGVLASRLGMTPETLSRLLAELRSHGLSVAGRRVVMRDRQRLQAYLQRR